MRSYVWLGILAILLSLAGLLESYRRPAAPSYRAERDRLERLCFQIDVKAGVVDAWQHDPARSAAAADMKLALDPLVAICHSSAP